MCRYAGCAREGSKFALGVRFFRRLVNHQTEVIKPILIVKTSVKSLVFCKLSKGVCTALPWHLKWFNTNAFIVFFSRLKSIDLSHMIPQQGHIWNYIIVSPAGRAMKDKCDDDLKILFSQFRSFFNETRRLYPTVERLVRRYFLADPRKLRNPGLLDYYTCAYIHNLQLAYPVIKGCTYLLIL